jgi:CRISPR-associated protein Csb1
MIDVAEFDTWLADGGPAALVMREYLEPVEGPDAVFFPATFAAAEDKSKFSGGYNIDVFPEPGAKPDPGRPAIDQFPTSPNSCLVDSIGSQANRIEPIFGLERLSHLIPQINIKVGDRRVSLLQAGHRAADALVRFSKAGELTWEAFQEFARFGNALALAKLAPTSLLFGVWDSRGTQSKVPRVFRSVIRANNVRKLTRSAQFNRAIKYVEEGGLDEALDQGEGDKNPLSQEGFNDQPAPASHGGVVATGHIVRDVTINLVAIRRLRATTPDHQLDALATLTLRRYILGLALVAGTAVSDDLYDLREGCQLREKPGTTGTWRVIPHRGADQPLPGLTADLACEFATAAASQFTVGASGEFEFDKKAAEKWLRLAKKERDGLRRSGPVTLQFGDADEGAEESSVPAGQTSRKSRTKR